MAHVMKQNQYFLFRTKDIHSKGLIQIHYEYEKLILSFAQ